MDNLQKKKIEMKFFISSTFNDLEEERKGLSKWVFPNLRLHFEKLGIDIIDVDLRWGASELLHQNTLIRCLNVIDSCRPYFIGIIGWRYGSIPSRTQFPQVLDGRLNWLDSYAGRVSVTEIEILHGVLNEPINTEGSLFFFKELKYDSKTSESPFATILNGNLSVDVAEHDPLLENLKQRIRNSGASIYETYWDTSSNLKIMERELFRFIEAKIPLLQKKIHESIDVTLLSSEEFVINQNFDKAQFINKWLNRYEKSIEPQILHKLLESDIISSEREVEIVLEEMRHIANYKNFQFRLEQFLDAYSFQEIYDSILERVEMDCGKSITRDILSVIVVSKRAFTEIELARYSGINKGAVGALLLAFGKGVLGIENDFIYIVDIGLEEAINRRYLNSFVQMKFVENWISGWT
jgi:hypothetical protein